MLLMVVMAVVFVSAAISLFFYFLDGYRSGWTFRERIKVMNAVLEEKYKSEKPNLINFIFFIVHFKLGWIRFFVLMIFVFIVSIVVKNYSYFVQ